MPSMEMQIITAKQMKKLAREQTKKEKAAKRERKKNTVSNPAVIQEILNAIKKCPSALESRFFLIYVTYDQEDVGEIFRELGENFEAYKRDFRKLGYCLKPQHDGFGIGYSIQW